MRRDNRGVTLVEMIIAIAITAIVLGAMTLFIRNALRGYKLAENTIDLQMEAQRLMEQLSTWVMEGNYVDVVKDLDSSDADAKVFVIYHIPRPIPDNPTSEGWKDLTGESWMRAFKCVENEGLYMYKAEGSVPDPLKVSSDGLKCSDYKQSLLSEYVMGIKNDLPDSTASEGSGDADDSEEGEGSGDADGSEGADKNNEVMQNKVTLTLLMKAGIQEYEFTDEVNMRNENAVHYILSGSQEP